MSVIKPGISNREIISGVLLLGCAVLAMIIVNSPLSIYYNSILEAKLSIKLDDAGLAKPLLLWINDGLMAIFFLLVGLELKREVAEGELSDFKRVIMPIMGAIGGMACPIIIFYCFNYESDYYMQGWAIPMATDIAFALGVLAMFGKRVPIQLKLFLLTLAIIDDLGAIIVIGLFHTAKISYQALSYAEGIVMILILINLLNISKTSIYLTFGFLLWICTLQSGFHATIAGVVLALTIPVRSDDGEQILHSLEENIKPLVTFIILPVFAFSNSGIPLNNMSMSDILHPVVLGISLGLLFGNLIGITIMTYITRKLFKVKTDYTNLDMIGAALLCGIGFTMSLFISGLSYSDDISLTNLSRLGIILGSLMSMTFGALVLNYSLPKSKTR